MVIDGPRTGNHFVAYVRQVLVPALRPGDVVVLDDLVCHKRAEARRAVEAAGATLAFLPADSPDLSPIEQVFSKLKATLRKWEERVNAAESGRPIRRIFGPKKWSGSSGRDDSTGPKSSV